MDVGVDCCGWAQSRSNWDEGMAAVFRDARCPILALFRLVVVHEFWCFVSAGDLGRIACCSRTRVAVSSTARHPVQSRRQQREEKRLVLLALSLSLWFVFLALG